MKLQVSIKMWVDACFSSPKPVFVERNMYVFDDIYNILMKGHHLIMCQLMVFEYVFQDPWGRDTVLFEVY